MAARELFGELLSRSTTEADWQRFFTLHPYVLSTTLGLAMRPDHIIPRGRNGCTEPDFVIHPRDEEHLPFYGIIELKRPDSPIILTPRRNTAILTSGASTAIAQSKAYLKDLERELLIPDRSSLCIGNRAHMFIIMGMKEEIGRKLGEKLFRDQIEDNLPRNLQLLPYDHVLERFESRIPSQVMILTPRLPPGIDSRAAARIADRIAKEAEEEEYYRTLGRKNCG